MSFKTMQPGGILVLPSGSSSSEIIDLLDETPNFATDGWDGLKRKYFIFDSSTNDLRTAIAAHFPRGAPLTTNMWVTEVSGRKVAANSFLLDVDAKGLLSARGLRISTSAAVATQSAERVYTPDNVLRNKIEVAENQVTCDISYISLGSGPQTQLTGKASTPPSAPPTPASVWTSLADPTYHYPNGWVLMGTDSESLPGVPNTTICLVTDRYQFIHTYSP